MRNHALLIALVAVFRPGVASNASPVWDWSHPRPTGLNIQGIHFLTDDIGWFVSGETIGEVYFTEDGGATWTLQFTSGGAVLTDIWFVDVLNGWVCGHSGVINRTSNGGQNWSNQYPGTSQNLWAVQFTDASYGTVVGNSGTIFRTSNGGNTWLSQTSGVSSALTGVVFLDPLVGWVSGPSQNVLYTESAGAFWQNVFVPGSSNTSRAIWFENDQTGWVVFGGSSGATQIHTTSDGGSSWSLQYPGNRRANDIEFYGSAFGIAPCDGLPGDNGSLVTVDGGQNWIFEELVSAVSETAAINLNSVSVPSLARAFAGGMYGILVKRDNSGVWSQASTHLSDKTVTGLCSIGDYRVWACMANGEILHSSNGGTDWSVQTTPGVVNQLFGIDFVDTLVGFACGSDTSGKGIVLKTVNGGSTWTVVTPAGMAVAAMRSVDFQNSSNGVVVGNQGAVYCTHDGGASWVSPSGTGSANLNRVTFAGPDNGWAVGAGGTVVRFDFPSDSWSVQYSNTGNELLGVFALSAGTGWAVGYGGHVIRTYNGGDNWYRIAQTGNNLQDVWFADVNNGYISRVTGGVYRTVNGGSTLSPVSDPRAQFVYRLALLNIDFGWGGGQYGRVLSFRDPLTGTSGPDLTPVPSDAGLSVSPNPVTGASSIAFTLSSPCSVRLSLYDVAGRLLSVLVDSELPTGEHSAVVDATGLPPGVYLLRLETGNTVRTGRCLVVP